jgi:hypothetical protein
MAKYFLDYEILRHERTIEGDTTYIAGVYADNGSYGIDLAQHEFDDINEAKQWAKNTIKVCKERGTDYLREVYGVNV